jgi:ribosome biogenesis protein SSF1/2
MSGPLGVTHLLVFSQPPSSTAFLTPSTPAPAPVLSKKKGKNPQSAKEEAEERAEKSLLEGTTTLNLRLIRLPRGPTLGFKVLRYSLASDILRMARRPRSVGREFAESPLVRFISHESFIVYFVRFRAIGLNEECDHSSF